MKDWIQNVLEEAKKATQPEDWEIKYNIKHELETIGNELKTKILLAQQEIASLESSIFQYKRRLESIQNLQTIIGPLKIERVAGFARSVGKEQIDY